MLGRPVCGSRTWIWQIAAPARAASMEAPAISSGVTGRFSLCARVGNVPVTAQLRIVGLIASSPISIMQGEQHASDQLEAKAHPPKPPMRNKHKDRQGRYALDTRKTLPDFFQSQDPDRILIRYVS